jgi:hypothetical protein
VAAGIVVAGTAFSLSLAKQSEANKTQAQQTATLLIAN